MNTIHHKAHSFASLIVVASQVSRMYEMLCTDPDTVIHGFDPLAIRCLVDINAWPRLHDLQA